MARIAVTCPQQSCQKDRLSLSAITALHARGDAP
jgi:hypothetical protein